MGVTSDPYRFSFCCVLLCVAEACLPAFCCEFFRSINRGPFPPAGLCLSLRLSAFTFKFDTEPSSSHAPAAHCLPGPLPMEGQIFPTAWSNPLQPFPDTTICSRGSTGLFYWISVIWIFFKKVEHFRVYIELTSPSFPACMYRPLSLFSLLLPLFFLDFSLRHLRGLPVRVTHRPESNGYLALLNKAACYFPPN